MTSMRSHDNLSIDHRRLDNGNLHGTMATYQSHCPQSRTFDIGASYMSVALLRLLGVTRLT